MKFLDVILVNPQIPMIKGKNYPFIEMSNVSTSFRAPLCVENKVFTSGTRFQDDDTVIARITPCLQNGKKFYCKGIGTGFGSTEFLVFRPRKECLDSKYLYYFMQTEFIRKIMINSMTGATGRQRVNNEVFKNIEYDFPNINVQRRIGDTLSAFDDLIENNQKQIKLLEEAAQRLYKEWYVDLRFPGHETVIIVDGVPEGWRKVGLGEICAVKKDMLAPSAIPEGTAYIGLEHMPRNDICLCNWGDASDVTSNKFSYRENDIMFGKIRPYFHKVGFALNSGVASTDSIIMRAHDGLWGLLLMTVSSDAFVDYTYQTCKEGSKMPRADWTQMKQYSVLVANDTIQEQFEDNVEMIAKKIKKLALQNRLLSEARDRLLPKLMSGELEV